MNKRANSIKAQHIAVLLPSLAGGGAERSMLHLVRSFIERGRRVDLLLCRAKGPLLDGVPEAARIQALKPESALRGRLMAALANASPSGIRSLLRPVLLPVKTDADIRHIDSLKHYLKDVRPDVLLSALTYTNLLALWAKQLSGVSVPVVVSERIALSVHMKNEGRHRGWRWRYLMPAVSHAYRSSNGIVAVSDSVARDLAEKAHIDRNSIKTIYNPVVDSAMLELADAPLEHPWFKAGAPPVVLAVGRLIAQKDFQTLIRAFAVLLRKRKARLVILGQGRQRTELESLAEELGIATDVDMPGFVSNPYQYMARASAFALTSLYEGLPGVLIQALACGCPVVSTDCPGGSAEILDHGKYGRLVPINNDTVLAAAMDSLLNEQTDKDMLRKRAALFSVAGATQRYLDYLDTIVYRNRHTAL
ncbi:MAG: glycosyltransferase [Pseudomonadota bacterium]|nr:glycosyltransferase [Pseudomonadota bacterium]